MSEVPKSGLICSHVETFLQEVPKEERKKLSSSFQIFCEKGHFVNRKMRVDGLSQSLGKKLGKRFIGCTGVQDWIDMVGLVYLTKRASLYSNLVQQNGWRESIYLDIEW